MLTEEQRQAIQNRIANPTQEEPQTPAQDNQPGEQQPPQDAAQDKAEETKDEQDAQGAQQAQPPEKESQDKEGPVPLERHLKLRRERNTARDKVTELTAELHRLQGRLDVFEKYPKQQSPAYEEQEEPAQDDDPRDKRLAQLEAFAAEMQQKEGQQLLNSVVEICQKADPTVPREFLVDRFSEGLSPEDAVTKWQTWTTPFKQQPATIQAQPVVARQAPTPPPAPPTVKPSIAGPTNSKPLEWRDVSSAVRRAITR